MAGSAAIIGALEPLEDRFNLQAHVFVQDKERMSADRLFLQHYAKAATCSVTEYQVAANSATVALGQQVLEQQSLQQELQVLRVHLASGRPQFAEIGAERQRAAAALAALCQHASGECNRLRTQLGLHNAAVQAVSHRRIALEQAVALAREELAAQALATGAVRERCETSERAASQASIDAVARDDLATNSVREIIQKLEADLSRERSMLMARERGRQDRIEAVTGQLESIPAPIGLNESKAPPIQVGSFTKDPASLQIVSTLHSPATAPPGSPPAGHVLRPAHRSVPIPLASCSNGYRMSSPQPLQHGVHAPLPLVLVMMFNA